MNHKPKQTDTQTHATLYASTVGSQVISVCQKTQY